MVLILLSAVNSAEEGSTIFSRVFSYMSKTLRRLAGSAGLVSSPNASEIIPVATSIESASSASRVPFFWDSCKNSTMDAARRRTVGFDLPLMTGFPAAKEGGWLGKGRELVRKMRVDGRCSKVSGNLLPSDLREITWHVTSLIVLKSSLHGADWIVCYSCLLQRLKDTGARDHIYSVGSATPGPILV